MLRTRIRELRKARRLTLKQLAARAGTTPQTIQRLET
ncbi:MAG: helix-turn-helix domain-containing protein, partial [Hyphomicrobiales bacterium]